MDLISRKSLLEKTHMADVLHAIKGITKSVEVVLADDVEVAPSAFEGMTNGEILETIFPNCIDYKGCIEVKTHLDMGMTFRRSWWDSPYKGQDGLI